MDIDELKIPKHLAIILDGNGRWAIKQGLARNIGHKYGAATMKNIVEYGFHLGIFAISLYCFSTENWKREKIEVDFLFNLAVEYFNKYVEKLIKDDVRVIISGDISKLPEKTRLACDNVLLKTKACKKNILNICLNYGSQDEIIKACKEIANEVKNDKLKVEDITKELFEMHLYSSILPPIDFLIRTSKEQRLSNFMLWQASYAELYFPKTLWPAFTKRDLIKALKEYSKRDRRFGGVNNEN